MAQLAYTLRGGITLQYDYYFVWLIAPLGLLIASIVRHAKLAAPATIVILTLYLAGCLAADFGRADLAWLKFTAIPPSLVLAVALIPFLLYLPKYPTTSVLVLMLALTGLSATIRPEKIGLPVWESGNDRTMYARVRTGMAFVSSFHFLHYPKFWISDYGQLGESIAYPRAYDQCRVETALPDFLPKDIDPDLRVPPYLDFSAGDNLVMVAPNTQAVELAAENLASRGLALKELGRKTVSRDNLSYIIVVVQLSHDAH